MYGISTYELHVCKSLPMRDALGGPRRGVPAVEVATVWKLQACESGDTGTGRGILWAGPVYRKILNL